MPKPPALVVLVCTDWQLTYLQEQTPRGIVLTVRTGTDGKVAAAEAPGLLLESSGRGVQPLDAFVAKLTQIVAADYSVAAMQTPLDLCESTSSLWAAPPARRQSLCLAGTVWRPCISAMPWSPWCTWTRLSSGNMK